MLTYFALSSFLPPRAAPAPVLPRGGRPVASLTGLRSGYLGRGTSWDAYGLTMAPDPNDPPEVDPRRKDPTTPSPRPFVPLPVVGDGNTQMDVISRLLRDRILLLGQQVDDEIGNLIVAQLLYLANEDAEKDVTLYINSPGGSVSAGMAMFDTMQYVPCGARALDSHPRAPRARRDPLPSLPRTPLPLPLHASLPLPRATRPPPAAPRRAADINTVCFGTAASMGAFLLGAGCKGKRRSLPNSRIMIHQPLGGAQGQGAPAARGGAGAGEGGGRPSGGAVREAARGLARPREAALAAVAHAARSRAHAPQPPTLRSRRRRSSSSARCCASTLPTTPGRRARAARGGVGGAGRWRGRAARGRAAWGGRRRRGGGRRVDPRAARRRAQPVEKIEEDCDRDFFMTPEEAKDYGIIDEARAAARPATARPPPSLRP